jgi:purine-binding chemotaxis protein CheW
MSETLQSQQYLSFRVNNQTLGVDILKVKEIVESGHVTTVPMMQPSIRGVINLRGSVVPVLDLSARFEQGPCQGSICKTSTSLQLANKHSDLQRHIVFEMGDQLFQHSLRLFYVQKMPAIGQG